MTMTIEAGLSRRTEQGGQAAVPLLGVDVRAEVVAGHARAVVRQRYRNDEPRPIEAVYTFPLPTRAVLTGFAMTVDGRRLEGEVQEREEAFRRYDDAITAGHGASLLEQERPNVFTANVGNLLPGEETVVEISYVEPVRADEGALRWSIPTLVAPRYVPGVASGDRTGHGAADPTDQVPDADRVSPPMGEVRYGLSLDLVFDVGSEVEIECPSHAVTVTREGGRTRVTFVQAEVALDRDVVVSAFSRAAGATAAPLTGVVAHKPASGPGAFAVTIVPDLAGALQKRGARTDVVFVLDRSGSMEGPSIEQARTALRLCLRQLREGDRFAVLAFDTQIDAFDAQMVPFTQATLRRADAWIDRIDARGGTEMLAPLVRAVELAPDGVVILLTDGQVANEDEIERAVLARRASARVYSFGIGTNVSDALLLALADKTGGAVESVHPGERLDEKVVAQFARATAPRVSGLRVSFRGIEVGEVAPADAPSLVDGEPLTIFGTYESAGVGAVELRGSYAGEAFYLEVPMDLPERSERPVVATLWAQARIGDLERAVVSGRRADAMKDRIVRLAKDHGVSSRYTSFVVVEKRTGDRRANAQPDTRVVPVAVPAGWEMFRRARRSFGEIGAIGGGAITGAAPAMMRPMVLPPMSPPRAPDLSGRRVMPVPAGRAFAASSPPSSLPPRASAARVDTDTDHDELREESARAVAPLTQSHPHEDLSRASHHTSADPVLAVLGRQAASGLWEEPGRTTLDVTVAALVVLLRAGVTAAHASYGAQVKKAVEALLAVVAVAPPEDVRIVELALAVAWLLSTGRRTRHAIEAVVQGRPGLGALRAALSNEGAAREHVDLLAC